MIALDASFPTLSTLSALTSTMSPRMRVLLTGGTSPIGRAVAKRLAERHGAHVALVGRSLIKPARHGGVSLCDVAAEIEDIGGDALPLYVDLRDPHDTRTIVRSVMSAFNNEVDALVLCAEAEDTTRTPKPQHIARVVDVNVRANLTIAMQCSDALKTADGVVVALAPPLDVDAAWIAACPHYAVSKLGLSAMLLGMAADGVRARGVWPPHTNTAHAIVRCIEDRHDTTQ